MIITNVYFYCSITGSGTVETPLEIWTCVNATAQFEAGCLAGPLDVPFKIIS